MQKSGGLTIEQSPKNSTQNPPFLSMPLCSSFSPFYSISLTMYERHINKLSYSRLYSYSVLNGKKSAAPKIYYGK
jgi:hypothetical protein